MKLLDFAANYCRSVDGSAGYLEQLTVLCRRLPWTASDLTPDNIDEYLDQALKHLSSSTVSNHRRMLRTLMRHAAEKGYVDKSILRTIRRVKVPEPCPTALTHQQILGWLAAAKRMQGGTKNCPYSTLLPAWILVAYSTGLRTGDMLAVRYDQIRGHRLLLSQHKTSEPHVAYLDAAALHAVKLLPRLGPKIFGSLTNKDRILHAMRRLVKSTDIQGTTRWLRRSGATYAEASGRSATRHLGHKDPAMKKRYIDRLLLAELVKEGPTAPPLPASLLGHSAPPRSEERGTEDTASADLAAWM